MASGLRVLVVDDSAVVREALRALFEKVPAIAAVQTAADGHIALRRIERFHPDVITMDVEMPGMDGLTTLRKIMSTAPRPVIMLSSFTFQGARKTIRALEIGAVDFIQKPGGPTSSGIHTIADELVAKVVALGATHMEKLPTPGADIPFEQDAPRRSRRKALAAGPGESAAVILAIGASTGGTEAIRRILTELPTSFAAGAVVTQHMPEGFTLAFANRLNELSELEVKEASHHDVIRPGRVLIAPGHSHMVIRREDGVSFVELSRQPRVNGHRPSVDVMFDSVNRTYGSMCVGVLLTGMGKDGARGLLDIRNSGGPTVAESEDSCVVYGMPKAAIEMDAADHICAVDEMPPLIQRLVMMRHAALSRMAAQTGGRY